MRGKGCLEIAVICLLLLRLFVFVCLCVNVVFAFLLAFCAFGFVPKFVVFVYSPDILFVCWKGLEGISIFLC